MKAGGGHDEWEAVEGGAVRRKRRWLTTNHDEALKLCGGSGWRREFRLKIREIIIEARVALVEKIAKYPEKSGPGEADRDAGSGKPPPGVFPSGF